MKNERGGTLVGFIVGVVVGLGAALAVAVYVTKVPVPFMNKSQSRSADQDAASPARHPVVVVGAGAEAFTIGRLPYAALRIGYGLTGPMPPGWNAFWWATRWAWCARACPAPPG